MEKLAIYGAGRGGRFIFNELQKRGINANFFIDKFIDVDNVNGIPVLRPNDVKNFREPLIVLISIPQNIPKSVFLKFKLLLKEFNLEKYFFCVEELSDLFSNNYLFNLTETIKRFPFLIKIVEISGRNFTKDVEFLEKANSIVDYLLDKKSLQLYQSIVKFRKTLNPAYLPSLSDEIQYFPENIFGKNLERLEKVETFIDLGAFVGDTAVFATEILKNLKNYFAFELDISNFSKLRNTLNLLKQRKKEVNFVALPVGGFSELECVKLSSVGPSSAINSEEGKILGLVANLDSIFINFKVDFVKMDIEGAELEALKGMNRIIKEHKPILAISIYHSNRDLVEIPKYLIENYGDIYNIHIRIHGELTLETVLYAVPKE